MSEERSVNGESFSGTGKQEESTARNFLEEIIENDLATGKYQSIHTRFPPEPNGYLHIGHATSICLNFGLARKYNGKCNLRFDDTNPVTEDTEYVESIKADIRWLGFDWDGEYYASDYFEQLYAFATDLIKKGLAYVCDMTAEEIAATKGDLNTPGTNSPYRDRSVEENLQLFADMRAGKYKDGEKTLRAKIDMAHPNLLFRDPLMYRIKHAHHHRTGDAWCIYPMYDFAHGQSDSIENITHSICTLEFIHHRPVYDWFIEMLGIYPSHQYEFARRNLSYTVMSKRKLLQLVNEKHVAGWNDPRMPTVSGMRRRGYPAEAIRQWCDVVGIAKRENVVDISLLEFCVRDVLNKKANRVMAVLKPLKLTITNYPEGQFEEFEIENNPEDPAAQNRMVPFGREVWIEQDDFMENPPNKFFRLAPGAMVRLKGAYVVKCDEVVKDASGVVTELKCSYIPESRSGHDTSGLVVKGTIHWVSAHHAEKVQVRLYDRLFRVENPSNEEGDFKDYINPKSMQVVENAYVEPFLKQQAEQMIAEGFGSGNNHQQFLRNGYFCVDIDSKPGNIIFNKTVDLKEEKIQKPFDQLMTDALKESGYKSGAADEFVKEGIALVFSKVAGTAFVISSDVFSEEQFSQKNSLFNREFGKLFPTNMYKLSPEAAGGSIQIEVKSKKIDGNQVKTFIAGVEAAVKKIEEKS